MHEMNWVFEQTPTLHFISKYRNLLKIHPWAINLKHSSKKRVGDISLKNTPTLYAHLTHNYSSLIYVLQCLICLVLHWCLPSFVTPSFCTVLLFWCFSLNIKSCTVAWIGVLSRETTLPPNFIQKRGVGLFSRGVFVGTYVIAHWETALCQLHCL